MVVSTQYFLKKNQKIQEKNLLSHITRAFAWFIH